MLLPLQGIAHVSSITHEGKVVVVATDFDGRLWYTVRRDGFEKAGQPSAPGQLAETPESWEPFAPVALPDEPNDDVSVVARERPSENLLRSIYREPASGAAIGPAQLISGMGHLYVFRHSRANTLRVDRFVLDGINNQLVRKLEVRYTRSKKRYEPEQPAKDGGRIMFDALDFRDRDGNPFYEPTTELGLIAGLKDGWFSVVLLPTDELDRYRWHIFAYNAENQKIELVSIAASEEGLFDLRDGRVAGIIRRRLDVRTSPVGAPAATKYDVQREVQTQAGKQWLRNATRVMLAVPTEATTAVIDFAAALDGTLSRIAQEPSEVTTLQGDARAVLLAPDTLEKIRAIGSVHPAASGIITGLAQLGNDQIELTLQRDHGAPLASDTQIEIGAGQKIDGTYVAHAVVVGRTLAAIDGAAIDRVKISALAEPLAKGTRLAVNATGSESIVVLSQRADVGSTALQLVQSAVDAPANALITLAGSSISIGSLAQEIHATDLKTLPLATGIQRALDAGTRLVVGAASRQAIVLTLAADASAAADEVQIEPAALAIPANAALSRLDAFDVDVSHSALGEFSHSALGNWKEIKQEETALVSDGMVTRITVTGGGRLRVHAVNHGLVEGDQVRISGGADYAGTWPIERIDADHFQLDARWQGGVATNLRIERARRRALTFDGDKDYIADSSYRLGGADVPAGRTHELWFRTSQARGTLLIYEYDLPANAKGALTEDGLISLSANNQGGRWISAGYSGRLVSAAIADDLSDGKWHHVAHTFGSAAQGQSLYVDGRLVASGEAVDLPANDYPGALLIGASRRNEVLRGFRGEIADVRVWERIRTPEEIASAMYGPLLGRESGLIRYWPLGAIVEGEPRKVVDLSASRRDAIVHGDVYAAPITLRATLADGVTQAIEYSNDALVAVAAGVRYEESFEFRMKNGAGEVIREKQQADELFKFHYRGKRSRSAEEWIALSDTPDKSGQVTAKTLQIDELGDGWFKAKGEFRLDEQAELTMMRSFGIAAVRSDRFDALEIRRHGLRAIAAGITEERYEDAGQGSADAQALALARKLRETERRFRNAEATEPTLLAERNHWQTLIELNTVKDGQARVAKLQQDIAAAKTAWDAAAGEYAAEIKDPTNYWCRITNPSLPYNNKTVSLRSPGGGTLGQPWISNEPREGDPWQLKSEGWEQTRLWAFIPDGTYFRITTKSHAEHGALCDEGVSASLRDRRTLLASEQSKAKWHKVVVDSSGKVQIKNVSGRILVGRDDDQVTVRNEIPADNQFTDRDILDAQRWILHPTTEPATQRFEGARTKSAAAKKHYDDLQVQLTQLQTALAAKEPQLATWKAYLKSAEDGLARAHAQMQLFGRELLNESLDPVSMNTFIADARGLKTHFAHLDFIDPASRITMNETADGNVQLAYFDRDGRMRLTRYDAAASTDNATFEQWLPDSIRTCLEFGGRAALTLSPGIALPAERTIEAWFCTPLAESSGWNVLAGATDNGRAHGHVVVRDGELGINLGGRRLFYGCGFNVGALHSGWHHLAAVTRAVEDGATTTFYIDGARVGDVMEAAVEAMRTTIAADSTLKSEDKALELEKRQKELNGRFFRTPATIDTIGNLGGDTETPFGKIAEFRVWDLALTDEEIEIHSKTELSGNEPGLLAWFPLNGDTKDHSGRVNADPLDVGGAASKQVCTAPIGHPGHRAAYFDGSGDSLHLPQIELPRVGTIEFWVKTGPVRHTQTDQPDGSTAWQTVFAVTDGKTGLVQFDTCLGYPELMRAWRIGLSGGPNASPGAPGTSQTSRWADRAQWSHVALTWDGNAQIPFVQFLLAGERQASIERALPALNLARLVFGQPASGTTHFNGWIAEVRLWETRRTEAQIKASLSRRARGNEPGLIGYWPLATTSLETTAVAPGDAGKDRRRLTPNLARPAQPATLINANVVADNFLPLVANGLVTNEYVTYGIDFATGRKTAMLRRFLAAPAGAGVELLAQKRVEQLELKWIGNAQFKPTLLGYIEGAPPVPSENLTVDPPSYNGAAAVELEIAEEVRYGWSREVDSGWGVSLSAFIGAEKDFVVLDQKVGGFKAGLKGEFAYTKSFLNTTTVDASSTSTTLDRVELRGSPEDTPRFASIGRRFVPKNIGYALVVSALADVFVTKLARTGRMVSYTLKAVEGIEPDVNTITFLINPAYTMNGSLDGLTGMQPTSERFFAEVPQMRAQYGAVYPASYYRLYDAYDRAAAIDKADAERATYFANFDAHSVSESAVALAIDVDEQSEEAQKEKAEAEAKKLKASRSQYEQNVHKGEVFESWQRKMEDLQIKAGKRNIVNTYVWDADGGTHVESQQFASTVEHTIGSSVDFNGKVGFDGNYAKLAFKAELTAQATFHLTQTMSKQLASSRTLSLNVDLSGVERQSVTDFKDRPYFPGEKVKRYRFMSFYLEGNTTHFDEFFAHVVDPEWLAGNSEGARALREVDRAKKNKTWRVMHRVTYVERPALAGFGRDARQVAGGSFYTELGPLQESVERIEAENKLLQEKLDTLLALVKRN